MPAANTKSNAVTESKGIDFEALSQKMAAAEDTGLSADGGPLDFTTGAVNFDEISTTFQPKPEGYYPGIVIESEVRVSNAGNEYVALTFELDGDNGRAWSNLPWTAKSLWRTKKDCAAMGTPLVGNQTPHTVAAMVMNARAIIQLGIEDYTNRAGEEAKRNNVVAILSADTDTDSMATTGQKSGGW